METSVSLRVNDNSRQWGGNNSSQGDKQNHRKQKMDALLLSINAGDLDSARQAFTGLVNFDLSVSADPCLSKIGAALQSSNLYAAKHFAQELLNRGGLLHSFPSDGHVVKKIDENSISRNAYSGTLKIDLSV